MTTINLYSKTFPPRKFIKCFNPQVQSRFTLFQDHGGLKVQMHIFILRFGILKVTRVARVVFGTDDIDHIGSVHRCKCHVMVLMHLAQCSARFVQARWSQILKRWFRTRPPLTPPNNFTFKFFSQIVSPSHIWIVSKLKFSMLDQVFILDFK